MSEQEKKLSIRSAPLKVDQKGVPSTLDGDTRSVEVIATKEAPVQVWDWDRWEIVDEVLLMSGAIIPVTKQVPLIDSHLQSITDNLVGSYRDIKIREKDGLIDGRAYFSAVGKSDEIYTKVREGHLTDFSVTYQVQESVWIPEKQKQTVKGIEYEGPVKISTKWQLLNLSPVPSGADENAKVRAERHNISPKELNQMDEKTRQVLEALGLKKDATEDEARAFMGTLSVEQKAKTPESEKKEVPNEERTAETLRVERGRISEVTALCTRCNFADLASEYIAAGSTIDTVRAEIVDKMVQRKKDEPDPGFLGVAVVMGQDERDKFRAAAIDAVVIRSGNAIDKPALGADELIGYSLKELARHSLRIASKPTAGSPLEMVGRAMTTSEFPYILANVANKNLFAGWEAANETWKEWCATGSVSDFKTHYSPRVSESSDLDEIPESVEYKYGDRTEAQESYNIVTYGKLYAITRQAIINDDLSALSDQPKIHGEAAARKVGDLPYAVLTANAAMGDGTALFASGHSNVGTGGVVAAATMAEAIKLMKLQKDQKGLRRLNIRPQYFLGPVAIEGTCEIFFGSQFLDVTSGSQQDNPYRGKRFIRIYEPRLDDSSAAKWYLAGPRGKTVTVFFLDGKQTPYLETKQGWSVDGVEYKVRIDCGAKAMDWKGLVYNAGA